MACCQFEGAKYDFRHPSNKVCFQFLQHFYSFIEAVRLDLENGTSSVVLMTAALWASQCRRNYIQYQDVSLWGCGFYLTLFEENRRYTSLQFLLVDWLTQEKQLFRDNLKVRLESSSSIHYCPRICFGGKMGC